MRANNEDKILWPAAMGLNLDIRETEIDRNNPYGGKVKYFCNVGKPLLLNNGFSRRISALKTFVVLNAVNFGC